MMHLHSSRTPGSIYVIASTIISIEPFPKMASYDGRPEEPACTMIRCFAGDEVFALFVTETSEEVEAMRTAMAGDA